MAKKGELARTSVVDTITKAFLDKGKLEGIMDKKIYVWAQDGPGGEMIQYAIAISAPKVPVTCGGSVSSSESAWDNTTSTSPAASPSVSTELSQADREKVNELMRRLGIEN